MKTTTADQMKAGLDSVSDKLMELGFTIASTPADSSITEADQAYISGMVVMMLSGIKRAKLALQNVRSGGNFDNDDLDTILSREL